MLVSFVYSQQSRSYMHTVGVVTSLIHNALYIHDNFCQETHTESIFTASINNITLCILCIIQTDFTAQ